MKPLLCAVALLYSGGSALGQQAAPSSTFTYVDNMPEAPVNLGEFLGNAIQYPEIANRNCIEGRVLLKFIVERDGTVSNVTVAKSVHSLLDAEAVRVAESLPRWRPGTQNGTPVRVYFNLPIRFTVEGKQVTPVLDSCQGYFNGHWPAAYESFPDFPDLPTTADTVEIPGLASRAARRHHGIQVLGTVSETGTFILRKVLCPAAPELETLIAGVFSQALSHYLRPGAWAPARRDGRPVAHPFVLSLVVRASRSID